MEKRLDKTLLFIGVAVHVVIFFSIFDVYFKSPLIHGMQPIARSSLVDETTTQPAAKRLCLFVADGLRADTFFNLIERDHSLYLR